MKYVDRYLFRAIQTENTFEIEALLSERVDANTKDADGNTSLHVVAAQDASEAIKVLLKHTADSSREN